MAGARKEWVTLTLNLDALDEGTALVLERVEGATLTRKTAAGLLRTIADELAGSPLANYEGSARYDPESIRGGLGT